MTDQSSTDRTLGQGEIPAELIARLQELAGCVSRPIDVHGLTWARVEGTWHERIAQVAREGGLEARAVRLDATAAIAHARAEAPLLIWNAERGWMLLFADRRGRVLEETAGGAARPTDVNRLLEWTGADRDENSEWLLVRARTPSHAHGNSPTPLGRLMEIVRPDRGDIIAIGLYAIFIGLLSLTIPIAVQQLVNSVAFGGLVQPVLVLALLLFLGLTFAASLTTFQAYLAEMLKRRVFIRSSIELAERLPRVRLGAFGVQHGPEQANRFFDLVTLQKTGAILLLEGTAVLLQTATGLLILSFYHPMMLALSVLLVSTMGFVVFGLGRGASPTAVAESGAKYAIAEWLEELVRHSGVFRNASGRQYAIARADVLATNWIVARSAHYRIVLRQLVGALGLQVAVNTLVLALGGFLVVAGELTLGQLVASEIIVAAVVGGFARLGKQLESFYDLLAAVEKVGSLFDLPVERERGHSARTSEGSVAIESFGLSHEIEDRPVVDEIDLRIEAGERIALCGVPGSGKSMLIDLLCALRSPTTGRIEVDGVDARELRLDSLRERLLCIREPEVFSGTVFENLQVARRTANPEEIAEALDRVGLLGEIRALPDGLDTRVSTDGVPLTRSQMARLMFARAFVAAPSLVAIDGELPFVEGAAREKLLNALFADERPFTLLIASDRADVIERCDRVVELPNPRRPRLLPHDEERSDLYEGSHA